MPSWSLSASGQPSLSSNPSRSSGSPGHLSSRSTMPSLSPSRCPPLPGSPIGVAHPREQPEVGRGQAVGDPDVAHPVHAPARVGMDDDAGHHLERQVQQRAPAVHLGEPAAGELGVQIDDVVADRQGVGPGETEGQLVAGRERLVAPEPEPRVGDHRQPPRIEAEEQARLDGHARGATEREVVAGRERHRHGGAEHPAEGGVAAAHDAGLRDEPQITDTARGDERRGAIVPLVIEADRQGKRQLEPVEEPDRPEQVGAHAAVERHADLAPPAARRPDRPRSAGRGRSRSRGETGRSAARRTRRRPRPPRERGARLRTPASGRVRSWT